MMLIKDAIQIAKVRLFLIHNTDKDPHFAVTRKPLNLFYRVIKITLISFCNPD